MADISIKKKRKAFQRIRDIPIDLFNGLDSNRTKLKESCELPSLTWIEFLQAINVTLLKRPEIFEETLNSLIVHE